MDLITVLDVETLDLSEEVIEALAVIEDSTTNEFVAVIEGIVVVQDGALVVTADVESTNVSELTEFVLAASVVHDLEDVAVSEDVVFAIVSDPVIFIPQPEEGLPPPVAPLPLPDIVAAARQEDGLVRVYYLNDTETITDYAATTRQGKQLLDWVASGGSIADYSVPAPSNNDIDVERDRRISLGFMITLTSGPVIPVQTRTLVDFRNISGLASSALALKAVGIETPMYFRDAEDVTRELTVDDVIELGLRVSQSVQTLYAAAWALKDLTDIPANYADDSYWPPTP